MGKVTILVLSDTHGVFFPVRKALLQAGKVDYIFHLGDYAGDTVFIKKITDAKVAGVRGNCDFNSAEKKEKLIVINQKKIFLTHGHKYGVKYSLQRLRIRASEIGADVCLYGHTHIGAIDFMDSIFFMNPGSISEPRGNKPTYGILELADDKILPRLSILK